jgi:oxygen-dependent protoporphyrinogen oxidase
VPADDALLRWLASVELRPTWTLALALDIAPRRDAFGLFHGGHHARFVSACAVHGAKMAAPPPDRDVVLAWPTPEAVHQLDGSPSERIALAMLPEIEALVPEAKGHVTRARVYRFEEGTPIARPGFAAERARGRALAEAVTLPVALAGDYLAAPLIEGAVASGERAAGLLAERLRSDGAPLDS